MFKKATQLGATKPFPPNTRPKDVDQYGDLYPQLPKPQSFSELDNDLAFARYRLSGPNPLALTACTKEQLAKFNLPSDKVRAPQETPHS